MTATITPAMTTLARTRPRPTPAGVTPRFLGYELRRQFNRQTVIFILLLPAALYLALFKTGGAGDDARLPHGNFAAWMMIGIAVYGAAMASTRTAATVSIERSAGWMRTIRLSPLSSVSYIMIKVVCSVAIAGLPVIVIGILGVLTGARADVAVWVAGLVAAWLGSAVFAALGIFLGLALKPEIVMHMPGLTLTVLAFLGNLFIPLSGTMLSVAQYTPMFGVATLARYPLTEGYTFSGEHSSLVGAALNVLCWLVAFTIAAARRLARTTGRQ